MHPELIGKGDEANKVAMRVEKNTKRLAAIEIEKSKPGTDIEELDAESAYVQSLIDSDIHTVRSLIGDASWIPTGA